MESKAADLAWILGGGGCSALLGAVFGAISGAIHWRGGYATGTVFGLEVVRAFSREANKELSPGLKGAIIGGVDGMIFLGILGTLLSAIVVSTTTGAGAILLPAALALVLLMGGALLFGLLAYGLLRAGIWALASVFVVGVSAGVAGTFLAGASGLLAGCLFGLFAGNLLALTAQRILGTKPSLPHGSDAADDPMSEEIDP